MDFLLLEFGLVIKDIKGVENQIAYHLSRILGGAKERHELIIKETCPDESVLTLSGMQQDATTPCYADLLNFLASGAFPHI